MATTNLTSVEKAYLCALVEYDRLEGIRVAQDPGASNAIKAFYAKRQEMMNILMKKLRGE